MARGGSSPLRRMEKPRKRGAFFVSAQRANGVTRRVATRVATNPPWRPRRVAGRGDDRLGGGPQRPRRARPDPLLDALGRVTEERLLEVSVERLGRGERCVPELALGRR